MEIKKTPASEILAKLRSSDIEGTDTMIESAWDHLNDNMSDYDGIIRISFPTAAGWAGISYPAKHNTRNMEIQQFIYNVLCSEFTGYGYTVTKYSDIFGNVAGIKISVYKDMNES